MVEFLGEVPADVDETGGKPMLNVLGNLCCVRKNSKEVAGKCLQKKMLYESI